MDSENPYASPRYTGMDAGPTVGSPAEVSLHGARRWGRYLIVRREAELPALCRKCGQPANGPPRKVKLKWTDTRNLRYWATLTPIFAGLLILAATPSRFGYLVFIGLTFVSGWLGNRFVHHTFAFYRLCAKHETHRRRMPWASLTLAGVGASAFVAGLVLVQQGAYRPLGASTALFIVATFFWGAAVLCAVRLGTGTVAEAYRIEGDFVWLKALPTSFLARIPELSDEELLAWRQLHAADDAN